MKRFFSANAVEIVLCSLFSINAVMFIWAYRFLPLQDYPDWLFQGLLFCKAMTGKLLPGYQLIAYPVPNSISTFAIGAFDLVFAPETSGKLFLTGYVLLFASGAVYLLNSLDPRRISPLSVVPAALILNTPFFTGNISYVFGLGVLFFALGYLLRRQDDPSRVNVWVVSAFTVLVFLSHAIVYFSLLLFMAAFVFLRGPRRVLSKFSTAAAPSLALLILYSFNHLRQAGSADHLSGLSLPIGLPQIKSLVAYFSITQYFYPFTVDGRLIDFFGAVNLVFCAALAVLFVWSVLCLLKNKGNDGILLVSASALLLLSLFSPHHFAGIIDPGERFLFPAALLLLVPLAPRVSGHARLTAAFRVSGVLLLLFQAIAVHGYAGSVSRRMGDIVQKLDAAWPMQTVTFVRGSSQQEAAEPALPSRPLLPKQSPLARLGYYLSVEHYVYTPIFPTGVIRDGGTAWPLQFAASIREMREFPDTVVVLGRGGGDRSDFREDGDRYHTVTEDEYCTILKKL